MFCSKCGKQIPDGSTCSCEQAAPAVPKAAPAIGNLLLKFNGAKITSMAITTLVFFFTLITSWYKADSSFIDLKFGPYGGPSFMGNSAPLSDVSGLLVLVKVFMIINIFVFIAYLATNIINVGALVPALKGIALGRLTHLAYYGIQIFCLIFGLIGALTADECAMAGGWWVGLIFTIIGVVVLLMPGLVSNISGKAVAAMKAANAAASAQENNQQ